jgi:hypothetical protein
MLGLDWIDSLVVGFDSVEQMDRVVGLSSLGPLESSEIAVVDQALTDAPPQLLDPSQWPAKEEHA